jgi:hypothetical protein
MQIYNLPQPSFRSPEQDWLQLRDSLVYRQAGAEGKRRMETNVSKGLPANFVTEEWEPFGSRGIDPTGRNMTQGYFRRPSGFGGGWGSVGMDRERKGSTGKLTSGPALGSAGSSGYDLARGMRGGPQPAEATPTPSMPSGGSPLSFTGFGGMMREQERETNRGLGSLTGFGGVPRFPFSNY